MSPATTPSISALSQSPKSATGTKRTHSAAEAIKDWIVSQALQPGDRLPNEQALMHEFQMAKGTIRESMRILEAQGIVKTRTGPNGGAFVHEVSQARAIALLGNYFFFKEVSIADIYQLRRLLEPELVYNLAGKLDEASLAELEKNLHCYETPAADAEHERQQHIASLRFHALLAEAANNPLLGFLIRFLTSMLSDLTVYRRLYDPPNRTLWETGYQYQTQLLQALRDNRPEEARTIMQQHMQSAQQLMEVQAAEVARRFLSEADHDDYR